jgi:hypothetical protein
MEEAGWLAPHHFPSKPGESPEESWQLTCPPVTSSMTPHRSSRLIKLLLHMVVVLNQPTKLWLVNHPELLQKSRITSYNLSHGDWQPASCRYHWSLIFSVYKVMADCHLLPLKLLYCIACKNSKGMCRLSALLTLTQTQKARSRVHYAQRQRKEGCDWCVEKVVTSLQVERENLWCTAICNWHQHSLTSEFLKVPNI